MDYSIQGFSQCTYGTVLVHANRGERGNLLFVSAGLKSTNTYGSTAYKPRVNQYVQPIIHCTYGTVHAIHAVPMVYVKELERQRRLGHLAQRLINGYY